MCGMVISFRITGWVALAVAVFGYSAAGQAQAATGGALAQSRVYRLEQLPTSTMPNGGQVWSILQGALPTGETVAVHESEQPAGAVANPLHKIDHSEIIVVQQGTVAFEHDGRSEMVGAGGVIFVAYGTMHRVKNAGNGPARYTVVQIGWDTAK